MMYAAASFSLIWGLNRPLIKKHKIEIIFKAAQMFSGHMGAVKHTEQLIFVLPESNVDCLSLCFEKCDSLVAKCSSY